VPGLFAYLAAGAAEGVGDSMVERAKEKREAALRQLEADMQHRRLLEREGLDRDFRRSEAETDRAFRAKEGNLNREVAREGQRELVPTRGGKSGTIGGDGVWRPSVDESGAPVDLMTTSKDSKPADVATAEWLIANDVADGPEDAWNKVRRAKDNPNSRAKLVLDTYKVMKEDTANVSRPDAEIRAEAQALVDELISQEDGEAAAAPNSRTESDAGMKRPAGATDEQIIAEAKKALKEGREPTAIRSRLRQWGIDPAAAGL
jgi:hypothetical protein